jgi:hypothetical protein
MPAAEAQKTLMSSATIDRFHCLARVGGWVGDVTC